MGAYGSPDLTSGNESKIENGEGFIFCYKCGKQYSKKIKKCPMCNTKNIKKSKLKTFLGIVVALFVLVLIIGSFSNNNATTTTSPSINSTLSETDYKNSCKTYNYADLARTPDEFKGRTALFTGQVIQVQENGNDVVLRVNVTKGKYDSYDDTVYVNYRKSKTTESRILEKDIITMWGEVQGITTYTSVLKSTVTIPKFNMLYWELTK